MEKKAKKKRKHTRLVLPGESVPKNRKAKDLPDELEEKHSPLPDASGVDLLGGETVVVQQMEKQDNTILLPKKNPVKAVIRRRKLLRRIRNLAIFAFAIWLAAFFATGAYLSAWVALSEFAVNLQIAAQPGNGFPMDFAMVGYKDAKGMGDSGFAILGEKDLGVVSAGGRELMRIQHGYVDPQITTSNNRVCVFNRGGKEYQVLGRLGNFATNTVENNILFAQLSPGGWLALCTTSRSRFEVDIYKPTLEWIYRWSSVDDIPLVTSFHTDNKTLALGCVTARNGAMGSTIYILRTDRDATKSQLASIETDHKIPVQIHFVAANRILVIYNQGFSALYDAAGAELARYEYGGRTLKTAHYAQQTLVLAFGSAEQDTAALVLLNQRLEVYGETHVQDVSDTQVLVCAEGAFLLDGQEVLALSAKGELVGTMLLETKPYGLVYGGAPFVISAGKIHPLLPLLQPGLTTAGSSSVLEPASVAQADNSPRISAFLLKMQA